MYIVTRGLWLPLACLCSLPTHLASCPYLNLRSTHIQNHWTDGYPSFPPLYGLQPTHPIYSPYIGHQLFASHFPYSRLIKSPPRNPSICKSSMHTINTHPRPTPSPLRGSATPILVVLPIRITDRMSHRLLFKRVLSINFLCIPRALGKLVKRILHLFRPLPSIFYFCSNANVAHLYLLALTPHHVSIVR